MIFYLFDTNIYKLNGTIDIKICTNKFARVDSIDNSMLSVRLADVKIVKYLYKHIEFLE